LPKEDTNSDTPFVSVIIIVRDMINTIDLCLRSVFSGDYPEDRYEVIVVDGGSKDGTFEKAQKYPVKCLQEFRNGRAIARNIGIKNAKGDIIAFLDADCVAHPDWLRKHVELHNSSLALSAVCGSVECETHISKIVKLRHYTYFGFICENAERKLTWDIATCNASFKRRLFKEVGLFDEKLDLGEDANLCWNAFRRGFPILFDPSPKVTHIYPQMTWKSYLDKKRSDGLSYCSIQIPYKFPKQFVGAALFAPSLYLLRCMVEASDLVRYLPSKRLTFALMPYIFLGSVFWLAGYFEPILNKPN